MPKKLQELRQFSGGTKSSPSSSDIDYESSIYSVNIDPVSEGGKLKGSKQDRKVSSGEIENILIWPKLTTANVQWETFYPASQSSTWNPYNEGVLTNNLTLNINYTTIEGNNFKYSNTFGDQLSNTNNAHSSVYYTVKNLCTSLITLPGFSGLVWFPYGAPNYSTYWQAGKINTENNTITWAEDVTIGGTTYTAGTELTPAQLIYLPFARGIKIIVDETIIKDATITFTTTENTTTYSTSTYDPNTAQEYIYQSNTTGFYNVVDNNEYLPLNAQEMELFSDEGKSHIAFYSKTDNDTELPGYELDENNQPTADSPQPATTYRMKVLEDIDGEREIVNYYLDEQTNEKIYFDIESAPKDVTLTKKNADIYIGTGNQLNNKSKWFGKIKHTQFDKKIDDYRLLDADTFPVDDGQAVFNLDRVMFNRHSASNTNLNDNRVYGLSSGINKLFGVDLSGVSNTNTNKGVHKSSDQYLPFTPTTIAPAFQFHRLLKGFNNQNLTIGSYTDVLTGHTHTDGVTSYVWAPNKNREELKLLKVDYDLTAQTLTANILETLNITFESGASPPPGTSITDIKESYYGTGNTDSEIWCLYTKQNNTAFTFEEEFLYSFNWDDINWNNNNITLKARTPSAIKMDKTKDVYENKKSLRIEWPTHDSWAGDGWYNERSNGIYWNRVDDKGNQDPSITSHTVDDLKYNRRTAKSIYNGPGGHGTFYLGKGGGYHDTYFITPFYQGLVDVGSGQCALLAHIEGTLVTSNGSLKVNRSSSWPDRYYRVEVHEAGTTKSINETKLIYTRKEHLGVNHYRVSNNFAKTTSTSNTNADGDWSIHDDGVQTNQYAIRLGGYRVDSTEKDQFIMKEFQGNTVGSGHEEFSDITQMPHTNNILSIPDSRVTDGFYLWVTTTGEQANSTIMMSWNMTAYALNASNYHELSLAVKPVNSNDFQPVPFKDIGNAVFSVIQGAVKSTFFLSATSGTYLNAVGIYEDTGNTTNGWQVGSTDFGATWETTNGYPTDTSSPKGFISYIANSKLDYGLLIQDGDLVSDNPNFASTSTYFYKISFLYDGYQESPLTNFHFKHPPNQNCNTLSITARMFKPSPRVTHMMVYRKNSVENYYRLVKEIPLESGWAKVGDDEYFSVFTDDGNLSATYEAITGMPEVLRDTNINYKLSSAAGGYLMIGNCNHPEIVNGQNFIFRSMPNNYSVFNWSKDYLVMPSEPTTLAYWANRLYVFDKTNMYKVEINNMVIEDTHYGVGCFGEESFVVTDYGMFFADKNNIYMHDGSRIIPLGDTILKSAAYDDNSNADTYNSNNIFAWHNIDHSQNPLLAYDAFNQNVMVMWKDTNNNKGSWNYNLPRKRWDLIDVPNPSAYVQGPNSQRFLSDGSNLYELNDLYQRNDYSYHSPNIDFGLSTVDKKIKKIKLVFTDTTSRANSRFILQVYSDNALLKTITRTQAATNESEHILEYKLPTNKTKKLRLVLTNCNSEIDSIGITYLVGNVK